MLSTLQLSIPCSKQFGLFTILDCQMDVLTSPITSSVSCLIEDKCTAVSCCVDIDFLQKSFETYITVDACNNRIVVGIEKLFFNISLDEASLGVYESNGFNDCQNLQMLPIIDTYFPGTENKFYLNSVIRLQ
jgi:hypothetical protein